MENSSPSVYFSCAYQQVPLISETQKLTGFFIGGRQNTFTRSFNGSWRLRNFFSRILRIQFGPLLKNKQVITYTDDTNMQLQNQGEMFSNIHGYHELLRKTGLKAAPGKTFFFLQKVKFLRCIISSGGIQPIVKRVMDLKILKSHEFKRDFMKVMGRLAFHSCYIKNLHVDSNLYYNLSRVSTSYHWPNEHEKIFQMIKDRINENTILAIPSTEYPFHFHGDFSND